MPDLLPALGDLLVAVDHVGIAVADLDAAIALHSGVFGLVVAWRERNDEEGVEEAMLVAPGTPDGATAVQLLAPVSAASPIGRFLARSGPGLQQLAYRVRDIERAAELLRGAGFRLLYDRPRPGSGGSLINFVHPKDVGGVLIELVETRPGTARGTTES